MTAANMSECRSIRLLQRQSRRLVVEVFSEGAELPLGLYVFGAVGNIATLNSATAECFRI